MSQRWYMIQAQSQREKKAVELLKQKLEEKGKTHEFEFHFLEQEETKVVKGKKRQVMKAVMPGYILVKTIMSDENKQILLSNKYVKTVVGGVSDQEADAMLQKLEKSDFKKDVNMGIKAGDYVQILTGPFATFSGEVESAISGKVKVNVSIFGRPTPVEISAEDVAHTDKVE